MATLGCASEYQVTVMDRGGTGKIGDLPATRISWGRELNRVSDAEITITAPDPECCSILGQIRTWRNELVIFRDGVRVWEGPIVNIPAGRGGVTVKANDVGVWLSRRTIHQHLVFYTPAGGIPADLSTIAEAVIRSALEPDDPNILPFLNIAPTGETGEREYIPNTSVALDDLSELADHSLDFTVLGRSIIIGNPLAFGQLARLGCDDFMGDVQTEEDGLAAGTRGVLIGEGVLGLAGGTDPYYGLIEQVVKDTHAKDIASAHFGARHLVANPPPIVVNIPSGSDLAPEAPVTVNQLVPGAMVPVQIDCTCRPAGTVQRLTKLAVTFDADGEHVKPTLVPLEAPTIGQVI